jgi:hypothetical protein
MTCRPSWSEFDGVIIADLTPQVIADILIFYWGSFKRASNSNAADPDQI